MDEMEIDELNTPENLALIEQANLERQRVISNLIASGISKKKKKSKNKETVIDRLKKTINQEQNPEILIEEEEIEPWEFIYDENYDPDMDMLMKDEKTREFQRRKIKSNSQLMKEVAKEWKDSRKLVTMYLSAVLENESIDLKEKIDETFINKILNSCEKFSEEIYDPLFSEDIYEYNWIEEWKKTTNEGGKGVVVKGKQFSGLPGIIQYRDRLSQAIQSQVSSKSIISQLEDIDSNEISPTSRQSVQTLLDLYQEDIVENELFSMTGQVVIKPSISTLDDLSELMGKIDINKETEDKYTINDLTRDIQNKLKTPMNQNEIDKFQNNVKNLSNSKSSNNVMLKDLFYDQKKQPLIQREPKMDDSIDRLAVIMENMTLRSSIPSNKNEDNPLAIGYVEKDNIVSTKYSNNVKFIKPYKDPHFTYLNETVEMWTPLVHYVTGLPVFTTKEEVLRIIKTGNIVYLKLQEVPVTVGKKTLNVMYFRKFLNFVDYLKAWQETYVKKIIQLTNQINKIISSRKGNLTNLSLLLSRRSKFLKRVRDIKMYFIKELDQGHDVEKMEIFISDVVVEQIIKPNEEIEGKVLKFLNKYKENIISIYNEIKSEDIKSENDIFDTITKFERVRSLIDYYLKYFPNKELSDITKDKTVQYNLTKFLKENIDRLMEDYIQEMKNLQNLFKLLNNNNHGILHYQSCYENIVLCNEIKNALDVYYNNFTSFINKYSDGKIDIYKYENCNNQLNVIEKGFKEKCTNFMEKLFKKFKNTKKQEFLKFALDILKIDKTEENISKYINFIGELKLFENYNKCLDAGLVKEFNGIQEISEDSEECDLAKESKNITFIVENTMDMINYLLEDNDSILKRYASKPLENIFPIFELLKKRDKYKRIAEKIYDEYSKIRNKRYETPLESLQTKLNKLKQQIISNGPVSEEIIKNKQEDYKEHYKKYILKEHNINKERQNRKDSANMKNIEFTIDRCNNTEMKLYNLMISIKTEIKRKANMEKRKNFKTGNNFQEIYNKILGYLEYCANNKKQK